jgi:hypothetical protein
MRVVVTEVAGDGSIRRGVLDTAGRSDASTWEELIEQAALAGSPPYRPARGRPSTRSGPVTRPSGSISAAAPQGTRAPMGTHSRRDSARCRVAATALEMGTRPGPVRDRVAAIQPGSLRCSGTPRSPRLSSTSFPPVRTPTGSPSSCMRFSWPPTPNSSYSTTPQCSTWPARSSTSGQDWATPETPTKSDVVALALRSLPVGEPTTELLSPGHSV